MRNAGCSCFIVAFLKVHILSVALRLAVFTSATLSQVRSRCAFGRYGPNKGNLETLGIHGVHELDPSFLHFLLPLHCWRDVFDCPDDYCYSWVSCFVPSFSHVIPTLLRSPLTLAIIDVHMIPRSTYIDGGPSLPGLT